MSTFTTHLHARPRPAASGSDVGLITRAVFAFFLMFQFPAFVYQFEYHDGIHSSSQVLQLISVMTGIFAVVMIFSFRGGPAAVGRCWPILALVILAFSSAAWSVDLYETIRASVTFLISSLFGLALAIRLPGYQSLRLTIRVMSFGCLLSVIWALALPDIGVHQSTDLVQGVHAGLWRGIFSHKQGLGVFAGFTFGLLAFYGSLVFPMIIRVGAIACAVACLLGTQSATGLIVAIAMTVSLYATYWISGMPPGARSLALRILVVVFALVLVAFYYDLLSFVPTLFGKSSDLTGRSGSWEIVRNNFNNSGRVLLGGGFGGFGSNFTREISDGLAIDNGYLTKLVEFGYLGSAVVFSVLGWIFFAGVGLVLRSTPRVAALRVFPASLMMVLAIFCISETGLMEKHLVTILISIAVHIIFQERVSRRTIPTRARGQRSTVGWLALNHRSKAP